MTKDELKDIARVGVRTVLLKFEEQLGELFHEFPDAFVSDTAPVLARPELRNGHAPTSTVLLVPHVTQSKSKKKDKAYGTHAALHSRRQASFDLLAVVEKSARPMDIAEMVSASGIQDGRGILPLIRRGYLKKTAKGYVRTGKVFYVDKNEAQRHSRAGKKKTT